MKIENFQSASTDLRIEEYFQGQTRAWGMFQDRFGNIRREFVVDITGTWDGRTLVLDEDFKYDDGEVETRRWEIEKTGPSTYEGRETNAIGVAHGEAKGNAFHWVYDYNLKVGDKIWKVKFDDWMLLQSDGVLLNRAEVSRWGINIGTVFLSFKKLDSSASAKGYDRIPAQAAE